MIDVKRLEEEAEATKAIGMTYTGNLMLEAAAYLSRLQAAAGPGVDPVKVLDEQRLLLLRCFNCLHIIYTPAGEQHVGGLTARKDGVDLVLDLRKALTRAAAEAGKEKK